MTETSGASGGLDKSIDRLSAEFEGVFARESVARCVRDSHDRLGPTRVTMYQPLLAYRFARERLRASAVASGALHKVDPLMLTPLAEIGVDAADAFPRPLTDEVVAAADVVVTMGCGDICPVLPGHRYLDWDLPDPAGTDLPTVRAVRDRVQDLLTALLANLLPTDPERTSP